tara:strand:- start:227 stop:454 length:228 start_codon:yes stop_codon:yes gene_type:complete
MKIKEENENDSDDELSDDFSSLSKTGSSPGNKKSKSKIILSVSKTSNSNDINLRVQDSSHQATITPLPAYQSTKE